MGESLRSVSPPLVFHLPMMRPTFEMRLYLTPEVRLRRNRLKPKAGSIDFKNRPLIELEPP